MADEVKNDNKVVTPNNTEQSQKDSSVISSTKDSVFKETSVKDVKKDDSVKTDSINTSPQSKVVSGEGFTSKEIIESKYTLVNRTRQVLPVTVYEKGKLKQVNIPPKGLYKTNVLTSTILNLSSRERDLLRIIKK